MKADSQSQFDSCTILVNRYIGPTYSKLKEYAAYFAENNVENLIVIENTVRPQGEEEI